MIKRQPIIKPVGTFLSKEGAMSAARILIGVVLGAAVGIAPLPVVVGIGAGVVGLTGLAHRSIEKEKQKVLLNTYHKEISYMQGKDDNDLTLQDLHAASKDEQTGKGSTAISMALDYFKDTRNFYIISQAVTAGLMIGGLQMINAFVIADTAVGSAASALGLAGAAGLLYNELFNAVKSIGSLVYDGNIEGTITRDIRAITQQISLGGRISSTRVMGILVCANEELSAAIEQQYGQHYEQLSIAEKREVVNQYDTKLNVIELTQHINTGRILPTELAFIAFGESSGTPPNPNVPDMHMVSDADNLTQWAARIKTPSPLFAENVVRMDLDENHATDIEELRRL